MKKILFKSSDFITKTISLSILLLFISFFVQGQEKGITLINRKNEKTVFFPENKRIKIRTTENKNIIGKYSIVDDKTILIKNQEISIDSIVMIRSCTISSQVFSPLLLTTGSVFVIVGTAGLIAGGYGVIASPLIPFGLPLILIPILANKHNNKKWAYKIENPN